MKKVLLSLVFLALTTVSATAIDLMQGKTLTVGFPFEFDPQAKADNDYITWRLMGDWDKFVVTFSQGTLDESTGLYTISSNDYKDYLGGINLNITGKPKIPQDKYSLIMKIKDASDLDLSSSDIKVEDLELNLTINYLLPPPPPLWKRLLIPAIILLSLALIICLVLHITAKFPSGLLQLGRDEVDLKGKKKVSVREELEKLGIELEADTDVIFVKKRFGTFQGPCIDMMKNCALERDSVYLSKGAVILPDEEIHGLKDINGNEIIIRYC